MKTRSAGRGFTLAEVMIGILLTALVVSAVMGVALTARRDSPRADRKMAATYAAKQLMDDLKNYITASLDAGAGPGPGNSWAFPGDAGASCTITSGPCMGLGACVNRAALWTGCLHNGSAVLPANLSAAPISMQICYCVIDISGAGVGYGNPGFLPQVNVTASWAEEQI